MDRLQCSYQTTFFDWIKERVSPMQFSNLRAAATIIDDFCRKRDILEFSLFEVKDVARIKSVQRMIKRSKTMWLFNRKHLGNISQVFQEYILFLETLDNICEAVTVKSNVPETDLPEINEVAASETEDQAPVTEGQAVPSLEETEVAVETSVSDAETVTLENEDNRQAFVAWMKGQRLSKSSVKMQLYSLNQCEEFAKKKCSLDGDLFHISSVGDLNQFQMTLTSHSVFNEWNRQQNGRIIEALNLFSSYLQEKERPSEHTFAPAMYNCANNICDQNDIEQSTSSASESEIDRLLSDEKFAPLRKALSSHCIYTIKELKAIKLWPFMNYNNLYDIATRQRVLLEVQKLIEPPKVTDADQEYLLCCNDSEFSGGSAAETFLRFCEEMTRQYPLKIRNLIGLSMPSSSLVALHKQPGEGQFLKMENPTAYINQSLNTDEVCMLTKWMIAVCSHGTCAVKVKAPAVLTVQVNEQLQENASAPSSTKSSSQNKLPMENNTEDSQKATSLLQVAESAAPYTVRAEHRVADKELVKIEKINELLLTADLNGMKVDALRDALATTAVETRRLLGLAAHAVEIQGTFYHEDAFVDWEEGADQLASIIDKLMKKNGGYLSATQLYDYARSEMNMFLNDNDINDERSVYDIAQHLFEKNAYQGENYSFHGKSHISMDGYVRSIRDLCDKYALEQGGIVSFDDLKAYVIGLGLKAGNLRTQLNINNRPDYMYYDKGVLIYSKSLNINDDGKQSIKTALTRLFDDVGDHIILRHVPSIWLDGLPVLPGHQPWTPLLLQYVLRFYGQELGARTIGAMESQANDTLHTMLVKAESALYTFGDVVIAWLLDNDISQRQFAAKELRQLLRQAGLIADNELITNMPKALSNDERFAWDSDGEHVKVRV